MTKATEKPRQYDSPLLEGLASWKQIHPELCYLTICAVGFPVRIFWHIEEFDSVSQFQVMRDGRSTRRGYQFWENYLGTQRQFFSTPEGACATFVNAWAVWVQGGKSEE